MPTRSAVAALRGGVPDPLGVVGPVAEAMRRTLCGLSAGVRDAALRLSPDSHPDALATGLWALVHGLASLHLDGKLDAQPLLAR